MAAADPPGSSGKASWAAEPSDAGVRLDRFLAAAERLGSRSRALAAIERGQVFLNDTEATLGEAAHRLEAGDRIRLWINRPGSATRAPVRRQAPSHGPGTLDIVYEDAALVVVNKPAGLLAVRSERGGDSASVVSLVEAHWRSRHKGRPFIVHRIDRDTSGLVVVARTAGAQRRLIDQFRRREPIRVYWAAVHGCPDPLAGVWRDRVVWNTRAAMLQVAQGHDLQAEEAISRYRVLEAFRETALLEVRLETGKRNQIRLQASVRGHPLIGEPRYVVGPDPHVRIVFGRQALHACQLTLRHPDDDRQLTFEAPIPADLEVLIARLRRR